MSSLQARKHELVRDAIWDAAIELFLAKGFDETTVEDIAAGAGVSRRTFFRYFASKNDLLGQGILDYAGALRETILACPAGFPATQVVREAVSRVAAQYAAIPRTKQIMRIAELYPAARAAQLSRMAELQELVREAFAGRGMSAVEAGLLAGVTLTLLSVIFRAWFAAGATDIGGAVEDGLGTLRRVLGAD